MTSFKKTAAAALVLLFAHASQAPAQSATSPRPSVGTPDAFAMPNVESLALRNGASARLVSYGLAPFAIVSLRVSAGRADEGRSTGLAQLTAEMLREGAVEMDGAGIAQAAAQMGANVEIRVSESETVLSMRVLSDRALDAVKLLSDLARRPTLAAEDLDRAKASIAHGLSIAGAKPERIAEAALLESVYGPDSPLGRGAPTSAQLNAYSIEDVRRFHQTNYGPARTRLYVVGRFDQGAIRAAIRSALRSWSGGEPQRARRVPVRNAPELVLIDRPGASQSTLRIAFPAPRAGADNEAAMHVADAILGGPNSRLSKKLSAHGYAYTPRSELRSGKTPLWIYHAEVATVDTAPALREILGEIDLLRREPPSEEEIAGKRGRLIGSQALSNASSGGLLDTLAELDQRGAPSTWVADFARAVAGVTVQDIQSVMRDRFTPGRMRVIVVGDLAQIRARLDAMPEFDHMNVRVEPSVSQQEFRNADQ